LARFHHHPEGITVTRVRYKIFAMNFLAALINYGDRVALSVAAPFILEEFHFQPAAWGLILSAFFWTYSPFAFFGGLLADRVGIRRAYLIAMLVWSLTIPLTASAWSFASFIVVRLLFGAGEGPQAAVSTKTMATWFPHRLTSTVLNMAQSGTTIGPIIATPAVVFLSLQFGWRLAFVLLGIVGVIWVAVWWFVARDTPGEHPKVDEAERAYITADHGPDTTEERSAEKSGVGRSSLREAIGNRYVIALAVGYFAYSWILFMFLTWYPTYLVEARGATKEDLASLATIPWVTATIGLIGGGLLADRLGRRIGNVIATRKWVIVASLVLTAVCFGPSPFVHSPALGVALVSAATMFLLASWQYQAIIVAVTPARLTGSVAGFIQFVSTLAGIGAPIAVGFIVEGTGSYSSAFIVGAALALVSAVLIATMVRRPRQAELTSPEPVDAVARV
jgi:MFS transporter, ACS family, hexuronate transporter